MTTQTYHVEGMTCGHCVSAATAELAALAGVTNVAVQLNAGATSVITLTSTTPIEVEAIAAALDEAGDYHLTPLAH